MKIDKVKLKVRHISISLIDLYFFVSLFTDFIIFYEIINLNTPFSSHQFIDFFLCE